MKVGRIAPSLDPASRVTGKPERLAGNNGIAFIGSYVLGMGFIMQPEQAQELIAQDSRNAKVLYPYISGQDLNSHPDCSASRWVVNFRNWPEKAAMAYPALYALVLREVKPERDENNRKVYRDYWWQYAEKRPALMAAIAELDKVIAIALVSKAVMPVMMPTGQAFSHMLGADIADLREIHRAIDAAVVRAYNWDDLLSTGLGHGFHDTRQDARYTIGPVVRQEILDRLLELNHERYAAEVAAGLHDKRTNSRRRPAHEQGGDALF